MKPLRIAFDMGGVISKYPDTFFPLIEVLCRAPQVEVHIISDMPIKKATRMLAAKGFNIPGSRVHEADWNRYGENCKAVVCQEQGIDILIDDHIGYLAMPGAPRIRLLVMPDPILPYYDGAWDLLDADLVFARRNPPGSKRPPEDRTGANDVNRGTGAPDAKLSAADQTSGGEGEKAAPG